MSRLQDLAGSIERREARVGVIGLGYVGLPLALAFAREGFRVTGFELDAEKVRAVSEGRSYIEDVESGEIAEARAAGRFEATLDFAELSRTDVIHVCVPTPLTKSRDPDFSHLASAVEEIRKRLRGGQLIVLGSTTYPGTTHELFLPLLEGTGLRVGHDFSLAFAPERIDPGSGYSVREVPKVVGGETPQCTQLAVACFGPIFDEVVPVSSSESAEMVKLLENTFRAINIGLANEVALMCDRLGLDVWEVIEAAATKPYGFMKFLPGPGLGGHCIPVDPTYLAWKMKSLNFPARFIELAVEINSGMPRHVARLAGDLLNEDQRAVNGARILLVGIAYKPDVSDVRESPALDVIAELLAKGADVVYHDPHIPEIEVSGTVIKSVELSDEALRTADLAIVTTHHGGIDWGRVVALSKRVLDTRNATHDVVEGREKVRRL